MKKWLTPCLAVAAAAVVTAALSGCACLPCEAKAQPRPPAQPAAQPAARPVVQRAPSLCPVVLREGDRIRAQMAIPTGNVCTAGSVMISSAKKNSFQA